MSVDPRSLIPVFHEAASAIPGLVRQFDKNDEKAGMVADFLAAALNYGLDLATSGQNPITHIERIHAADTSLEAVESAWQKALRDKFGGK